MLMLFSNHICLLKPKRQLKKKKSNKVTELKTASKINDKYYGELHDQTKGIEEWQKTIPKAPRLISGSLKPITDLIRNKSKKREMEKAINYHLLLAKMRDLKTLTDIRRKTWHDVDEQLNAQQKKLEDLKEMEKLKTLTTEHLKDTLQDIENQVRVPQWFTNKVKFCLKYVALSDIYQCNEKAEGTICAGLNQMTEPYLDKTDTRDGGCGMNWKFFISEEPKSSDTWLRYTQIVFRWYSVWSPCACGGRDGKDDVPFKLSAAPNSWTQEYFDDTSEKNGECIMQWMLKVPEDAPAWAKNIHLCIHMSCGNLEQCVRANHWTPPYMDISTSNTRCSMSWGIRIS